MQVCATLRKNLPNGKNAEHSIAHRNGLKVNGVNVPHHVDKMVQESGRSIAKRSVLTGEEEKSCENPYS